MRFGWKLVIYAVVLCIAIEEVNGAGGSTPGTSGTTPRKSYISILKSKSKSECPEQMERMDGKRALVTGANSGIGFHTTLGLLRLGASVVMGCKDLAACFFARKRLINEYEVDVDMVICMGLDLRSYDATRDFAEAFKRKYQELHVIVHNAGMSLSLRGKKCLEGEELTMKTNYLTPWFLTHLLIDLLRAVAGSRIVIVSSDRHNKAKFDVENWNGGAFNYAKPAIYNYWNSKRALILFAMELADRLEALGIAVYVLHPGATDTNIWNAVPFPLTTLMKLTAKLFLEKAATSAQTSIYLASNNVLQGLYFEKCKEVPLSGKGIDSETARKLWATTIKEVPLTPTERDSIPPRVTGDGSAPAEDGQGQG